MNKSKLRKITQDEFEVRLDNGDTVFKNLDMSDLDISGKELNNIIIDNCLMHNVRMNQIMANTVQITNSEMATVDMCGAKLSGLTLENNKMQNVGMDDTTTDHMKINICEMQKCSMINMSAPHAYILNSGIESATFARCNMPGLFIKDSTLKFTSFDNARIPHFSVTNTVMTDACGVGNSFENVYMDNAYFDNVEMSNARMQDSKMAYAVIKSSTLDGMDMENVNMPMTIIENSELKNIHAPNIDMSSSKINNCTIENMNAKNSRLNSMLISDATCKHVKLPSSYASRILIDDCKFEDISIPGISISRSEMKHSTFKDINADESLFGGNKISNCEIRKMSLRSSTHTNIQTYSSTIDGMDIIDTNMSKSGWYGTSMKNSLIAGCQSEESEFAPQADGTPTKIADTIFVADNMMYSKWASVAFDNVHWNDVDMYESKIKDTDFKQVIVFGDTEYDDQLKRPTTEPQFAANEYLPRINAQKDSIQQIDETAYDKIETAIEQRASHDIFLTKALAVNEVSWEKGNRTEYDIIQDDMNEIMDNFYADRENALPKLNKLIKDYGLPINEDGQIIKAYDYPKAYDATKAYDYPKAYENQTPTNHKIPSNLIDVYEKDEANNQLKTDETEYE